MPRKLQEQQQIWPGGQHGVSEPERIPKTDLVRQENWDQTEDKALESAPGYITEVNIPRRRVLANFENDSFGENENWTGDGVFDRSIKQVGVASLKHTHVAVGQKGSNLTGLSLGFIGTAFTDNDLLHIRVFISDVSDTNFITIFFRDGGAADQFDWTISSGFVAGWQEFTIARTSIAIGAGAPSWSSIDELFVLSDADNAGTLVVHFDDLSIISVLASGGPADEPITGLFSYEQISARKQFLMAAAGQSIYALEGGLLVPRADGLTLDRMVHMLTANDMVVAYNGIDDVTRWDPQSGELGFLDMGVPKPPNTMTVADGAAGVVGAGLRFHVVTFLMGSHGEGLPNDTPVSHNLGALVKIAYGVIPLGPPGTTARKVYRTVVGGTAAGPFLLDADATDQLQDNTTVSVESNDPDSALEDTLVLDGDKPKAFSYMAFANNTLWGARPPGALLGSSVFFSDTTRAANRTIEQWALGNELKLNPDDGDVITGLISHRGFVYVFKRFSFFQIDPVHLTVRQISSIYGAVSQRSIVDDGTTLKWISPDRGPIAYRQGGTPQEIGIKPEARDDTVEDFHAVNGNIISTALTGISWATKADFDDGIGGSGGPTFLGTPPETESAAPGLVRVAQSADPTSSQDVNVALLTSTTAEEAFFSSAVGRNKGQVKDVSVAAANGWELVADNIAAGTPRPVVGSIILNFAERKINRIEFDVRGIASGLSGGVFDLSHEVYYKDPTTSNWVLLQTRIVTEAAPFTPRNFVTTFAGVDAIGVRVHFTSGAGALFGIFTNGSPVLRVHELRFFDQGFFPSGQYETDIVNIGGIPTDWGRVNAAISGIQINKGINVVISMRSGTSAANVLTQTYQAVPNGTSPDTSLIPLNTFVQFLITFTTDTKDTSDLESLNLTFSLSNNLAINPRFETAGVYFRRFWWYSIVPEDSDSPDRVWKQHVAQGWGRHGDYALSVWALHTRGLFSGSSIDGNIFRNVEDVVGDRIRAKDGRVIPCLFETANTPLGNQSLQKTVRDFIVAVRNEAKRFPRAPIMPNADLELWNSSTDPSAWTVTGEGFVVVITPSPGAGFRPNKVIQEQGTGNVGQGFSSARIEYRANAPTAELYITNSFVVQASSDYNLDFLAKFEVLFSGVVLPTRFRLRALKSDGTTEYLQDDGTWAAGVNDLPFPSNVLSSSFVTVTQTFTTPSDYADARIFLEIGFNFSDDQGFLIVDDFVISPVLPFGPSDILITPILDEVPLPPVRMVTNIPSDLEVVTERFRIDQTHVRNLRFRVEHANPEASAKMLGLWVNYAFERVRDEVGLVGRTL